MLSYEIREQMRQNAYELIEIMLLEAQEFRIVLWNNDNWNAPLPAVIMESFPTQIVLDIKDMALDESYVDENTGEIIIVTSFEGSEYSKVLEYDEVLAVLDLAGQPYMLNNFPMEEPEEEEMENPYMIPRTRADLIELAVSDGLEEETVVKSIDSFLKNNPALAAKFQ